MTTDNNKPMFATTEERSFKTCPLAHHFEYELGYRPRLTNTKLSTGIIVHEGLAAYYQGEDAIAVVERYADERWEEILGAGATASNYGEALTSYKSERELSITLVKGYIEHAERERWDDNLDVVAVEEGFLVEIPGAPSILPVRIDVLFRSKETGRLIPCDHKTARYMPKDYTPYQLSEQNANYQLAVLAKYGEVPQEMIYNFLRKIVPGPRSKPPYFARKVIRLHKNELKYRAEEYRIVSLARFDPDRPIYAAPDNCCGSWKNDWRQPCMLVHQGMTPLEALEASPAFAPKNAYDRYNDVTEEGK